MARSKLAKFITAIGVALLLASVALFTNGYSCTFNELSCGMVEPLLGLPMALVGFLLFAFGLWAIRHDRR